MLTLAKAKSFSEAARELEISQPSLSQYIKKLEEQLNVKLVDCSSGEVQLTDAGRVYVEIGNKMQELQYTLECRLADINSFQEGSIRIGISPYRCIHMMPEIVSKFKKSYPGIKLVLDECVGSELLDSAEKGLFDLFVTTLPVDETLYEYKQIMLEEMVLVVPKTLPQYEFISKQSKADETRIFPVIDICILNHVDFVCLGEKQLMQIRLNDLCNSTGISINKVAECVSIEAQLALVEAGIGAALLPSGILNKLNSSSFSIYSLAQANSSREIVVCYRRGQYLTSPMRKIIELMQKKEN